MINAQLTDATGHGYPATLHFIPLTGISRTPIIVDTDADGYFTVSINDGRFDIVVISNKNRKATIIGRDIPADKIPSTLLID